MDIEAQFEFETTTAFSFDLRICYGNTTVASIFGVSATPGWQTINIKGHIDNITLASGNDLWVAVEFTGSTTVTKNYDLSFRNGWVKVTPTSGVKTTGNNTVELEGTLPKMKQRDLLEYVLNQFQQVFNTDPITKTIYCESFNTIEANKTKAIDWSDKIDLSEDPEVRWRFPEYGQNNLYTYKNDSSDKYLEQEPDYGTGSFTVDDRQLEDEKTLYEAPFSATMLVNSFTGFTFTQGPIQLAYIPKYDESSPFAASLSSGPRVGLIRIEKDDRLSFHGATPATQSAMVHFDELDWQTVIDTYYQLLLSILSDVRIVTPLIKLNAVDFNTLDHMVPVWIEYFNSYFYVNIVKQYDTTSNESTYVELVRIP